MKKKIALLSILILLFSCQNTDCLSNIKSLEIYEDQSSKIDLLKGTYTVHFMNKRDSIINFPVSRNECKNIIDSYFNNNICSYGKDILIQENDPLIMPATEFKYIIELDNGKKQTIIVRTDFNKDPLDKRGNEKMKKFIDNINRFLNGKMELKNKPKSDIFKI